MCVCARAWASAPLHGVGLHGGTGMAMMAQLLGDMRCLEALRRGGDCSLLGHLQLPPPE